jgi:hypothetical protein
LKKNITRCQECERRKKAQFTPNLIRPRSIGTDVADSAESLGIKGVARPGSENTSSATGSIATNAIGSGIGSTGAGMLSAGPSAAGAAAGSAGGGAARGALSLASRTTGVVASVSRFLAGPAIVGLMAAGTFMTMNYLEELISSALAGSPKINPMIAKSLEGVSKHRKKIDHLEILVIRMQGMSEHIDNKAIKLSAAIGATRDELKKEEENILSRMVRQKT